MKALIDANVVLDVLMKRQPHYKASAAVWAAVECGRIEGVISAHAATTIYYLLRKHQGASQAKTTLFALLEVFSVATVSAAVIAAAFELPSEDFEDCVTSSAARFAHCGLIVTRDEAGFRGSRVRAVTPEAAIAVFAACP